MKHDIQLKLAAWCRKNGIDLAVLFGSQVKGKTHARSDTDIALLSLGTQDLRRQWLRLNGQLEDLFAHPVDLVIIDRDTDPVLRLEIFHHGRPLFASRPGLFDEQHIVSIKIYDDTEPLRRVRDRVLTRRILNLKYVGILSSQNNLISPGSDRS